MAGRARAPAGGRWGGPAGSGHGEGGCWGRRGVGGPPPCSPTNPPRRSTAPPLFENPLSNLQSPVESLNLQPLLCETLNRSNALGCRVPDKLVQLQPEPDRQPIFKNPFHERARFESRPLPLRIFKHR